MLRKSLFALSFLIMCPVFSCAKTQYYDVKTIAEHCTFGEVKKAQWGREYSVKIYPDPGYVLFMGDDEILEKGGIHVYNANGVDISSRAKYEDENLIVFADVVSSSLKIVAIAETEG